MSNDDDAHGKREVVSNARAHRRRLNGGRRAPAKELVAQALADAARLGCTCRPDVEFLAHGQGFSRLSIAHDSWCPAANARSALIIKLPPEVA